MNRADEQEEQLCAVCLQKLHHPAQLPCGHIFCFLCVKGVAFQNHKCAMCRSDIPTDYFNHPVLLDVSQPLEEEQFENQWYYEGRNGWWKYDERSNIELENKFNDNEDECTLLLAGALYCVNFRSMIQVRSSDQTRKRRVKRDVPTLPSKGIAGIKISSAPVESTKSERNDVINSNQNADEVVEIGDDDDDVQVVEPVFETVNVESEDEISFEHAEETENDDVGDDVSEVLSMLSLT